MPPFLVFPIFFEKETGKKRIPSHYRYGPNWSTVVPHIQMANARARTLECHHASIMRVVLCCVSAGVVGMVPNLDGTLIRRRFPCNRLIPEPFIPHAHVCAGLHVACSMCSHSMIGLTRCYRSGSVRPVLHKQTSYPGNNKNVCDGAS